jgi:hypothetical protein
MVYTEERLKRALDVFRASEPYRKRRGLAGSNLGRFLESRSKQYETRSGKSSLVVRTTITSSWNDKDESGDYTPTKTKTKMVGKTQKQTQNGPKRKRCDVIGFDGYRASKRNKMSYKTGRQNGLSLDVTFKFKSDAAKARVAVLFPPTTLDAVLNNDDHHIYGSDRDNDSGKKSTSVFGHNENSLVPALQAPSSSFCRLLTQPVDDHATKVQRTNPIQTIIPNKPTHHRLATASESDPIIIDDSDDSTTDYGGLLDNTEFLSLATQTKIINTNWAHPIDYGCKPEACNFCQDFRYSLFGCGAVEIEVIQLEPGVYEEMGGGHREKGMAPTKICLNCSLERIAIAKCPGHEILLIDGCLEDEFDHQSFLNHITESPYPAHPTCSVCIRPAFYACATTQNEDPFGLPLTGDDVNGCGLLLCGDCARIVANCGLNMEHLEGFVESSKIFRADRDFLLPGSDLWQAWRK